MKNNFNMYNNLMTRKQLILRKFELLDVKRLILNELEKQGINIKNENIFYIINMIDKVLFEYYMYGVLDTNIIIKDNSSYFLSTFTKDKEMQEEIKSKLNKSIKKMNLNFDSIDNSEFERFIIKCATNIKEKIDKNKQYTYTYSM